MGAGEHQKRFINRHFPSLIQSESDKKKRKERMCIVYNQLMRKEEKEIRVKV